MADLLFRGSPFFEQYHGEKDYHSAVLVFGIDAVVALDYRGKMSSTYKKKYADVEPTDLFQDFKDLSKVPPGWWDEYREAFDLLELMLTLDYKKRPMANELLQHPFFLGTPDMPKPREKRRPPPVRSSS